MFDTLLEAKVLIERWRREYNTVRPHSSLGYRPPAPEARLTRPPRSDPATGPSRGRPLTSDVDPPVGAGHRSKGTYLSAQFKRVSARREAKRAAMAVGHTILVIAYHVLKRGSSYAELGSDYLDRLEPERLRKRLVRRLEQLGHKVTLEPAAAVV